METDGFKDVFPAHLPEGVGGGVEADGLCPERVIETVAEVFGCTLDEIRSPCRQRHLVTARMIIAVVLKRYPMQYVGRMIGRDHSTVHFYRRTFDDGVKYDGYLRGMYERVKVRMSPEGV